MSPASAGATAVVAAAAVVPTDSIVAVSSSIVSVSPGSRLVTLATFRLRPSALSASVVDVPAVPTEVITGDSKMPVGQRAGAVGEVEPGAGDRVDQDLVADREARRAADLEVGVTGLGGG